MPLDTPVRWRAGGASLCAVLLVCGVALFYGKGGSERSELAQSEGWQPSGLSWPGLSQRKDAARIKLAALGSKVLQPAGHGRLDELASLVRILPSSSSPTDTKHTAAQAPRGGGMGGTGEGMPSVRVQAAMQYDRDMETATQAEEMRTHLKELETGSSPRLREALGRVRAVLSGGSEQALHTARDMLQAVAHTEALDEQSGGGGSEGESEEEEWKRSCEPDCGKVKNVFDGIDTTKYPYDERHGGHKWTKYSLPESGIDKQYAASERGEGPEDHQQRKAGGYVWKDLAAVPEKNVWDHVHYEHGPVYKWSDPATDPHGYYTNVLAGQGGIKELYVEEEVP
eukprot:CAMPEP_0172061116 /NCGR_PEP_ID=MMETSP1043-20130122/8319_1 /TAXON_ID=464988 /ORGANISM="Hemiselmis andersenii, Strain CCMP441" /LENGTH=339 /DNA_ID=CAMNT_0012720913 /DNA_START=36 /DNA_END=1051 /DNA_ORIENTATION=+